MGRAGRLEILVRAGAVGAWAGHVSLRQRLSRILCDRGIEASPDQIVLTESGTQALDLLCRLLIEPGDTVLVDDPCYFNFRAMLRAHRARVVGVPYTPSGPDLEALSSVLTKHEPRLYITNSARTIRPAHRWRRPSRTASSRSPNGTISSSSRKTSAQTGAGFMRFNVAQMSAPDAFDTLDLALHDAGRSPRC